MIKGERERKGKGRGGGREETESERKEKEKRGGWGERNQATQQRTLSLERESRKVSEVERGGVVAAVFSSIPSFSF